MEQPPTKEEHLVNLKQVLDGKWSLYNEINRIEVIVTQENIENLAMMMVEMEKEEGGSAHLSYNVLGEDEKLQSYADDVQYE